MDRIDHKLNALSILEYSTKLLNDKLTVGAFFLFTFQTYKTTIWSSNLSTNYANSAEYVH